MAFRLPTQTASYSSKEAPVVPPPAPVRTGGSARPLVVLLPLPRPASGAPPPWDPNRCTPAPSFRNRQDWQPRLRVPHRTDPVPKKLFSWGGYHLFRHDPLHLNHQEFYRLRGVVLLIVEEDCSLLEEVCNNPIDQLPLLLVRRPQSRVRPRHAESCGTFLQAKDRSVRCPRGPS
jgi:hypothetical protein